MKKLFIYASVVGLAVGIVCWLCKKGKSNTAKSQTIDKKVNFETNTQEEEKSQNEDTWGEVTWYTLNCSLKAELPEEDKYAWTATAVDLAYDLRYVVYVILLVSLAVLALSFVGLMSVAGRRPDTEEDGEESLTTIDDDEEFDRVADYFDDMFSTVDFDEGENEKNP